MFNLSVVSGKSSRANQYHVLINPATCIKNRLKSGLFIKLHKDKRTLVVNIREDKDVNMDCIEVHSRTHAATLFVTTGDIVMCEIVDIVNNCSKLIIRLCKNNNLITYPRLNEPLYVSPNYHIVTRKGIGIVEKGEGLYIYNPNDILSDDLIDNSDIKF